MPDDLSDTLAALGDFVRPYPNEHACRMRDPGDFQADSFRRIQRKHDGKPYAVIVGRPKGQTTMREQAIRYPLANWTESSARAHCTSHGGKSFEAATGEKRLETIEVPLLHREAQVAAQTIDEDRRTIEVCWTTGARVRRRGLFDGEWDEELSVRDGAVQLQRLNSGAPVLNSHAAGSLTHVIGVVEQAWMTGEGRSREGRATLRFSERAEVEPIWQDVKSGILRNISVGYRTHKITKIERKDDVPLMRADLWEPYELSLVAVPADAKAQVRGGSDTLYPCTIERTLPMDSQVAQADGQVTDRVAEDERQEHDEPQAEPEQRSRQARNGAAESKPESEGEQGNGGVPAVRQAPAQGPTLNYVAEAEVQRRIDEAIRLEAARCDQIRRTCTVLKLDAEIGEAMIREKIDANAAWLALVDEASKRQAATAIVNWQTSPQVTNGDYDEQTIRARSMTSMLLHRADPGYWKLEHRAGDYTSFSLLELARHWVEAQGIRTVGMNKLEIAGLALRASGAGYLTTSDFASVLLDVTNKSLRRAYTEAPRTFTQFARRTTIPDFRNVNRIQLGEMPSLMLVTEHGEYKRTAMSDAKEAYALETYGAVFPITRKVVVNDDLEAFTRLPQMFGTAAARTESDIVWGVLTANAAMGDGTALFHANHGNLKASGSGAPTVATIGAGRASMRVQRGLGGSLINVEPRYLIVPAALETVAEQFLSNVSYVSVAGAFAPVPERLRASLTLVVEPRLDAASVTAWYLAADPAQIDTIEYAYLEGQEGVSITVRNGFDIDGIEVKASIDFAAKPIDWRGLYKDNGV